MERKWKGIGRSEGRTRRNKRRWKECRRERGSEKRREGTEDAKKVERE